ncbi:unnamed protein product, partial [Phaeothamnion confervicola]
SSDTATPTLVIGPTWYASLVGLMLLAFSGWVFYYPAVPGEHLIRVGWGLTAAPMLALLYAALADPGIAPVRDSAPGFGGGGPSTVGWALCGVCDSYRGPGTVHCSTCKVCIEGYHHHCFWLSK